MCKDAVPSWFFVVVVCVGGPLSIAFSFLYERVKNKTFCSNLSDAAFDAIHEELKRRLEGDDPEFWELLVKLRNEDATRLLNVQDSVLLKSLKGSGLFETIHDEADNPASNIVSSFLALDQESIQKIQSLLESFRNTWSADDQGKVMSLQQQLTGKFPLKLTKTPTEHQVQL